MRKIIYIIVLAFVFGFGSPIVSELINTKQDISAQSKPRKKKSSKGRKTIKVKSYKKKNGTRVKSYKRKAPKKKRK
ncbi:MAG TPA: hypothetical protein VHP32_10915 [Ignavibacteria bacterium]|nr:hypothetical protein [Ignavibacteria bacterium]